MIRRGIVSACGEIDTEVIGEDRMGEGVRVRAEASLGGGGNGLRAILLVR